MNLEELKEEVRKNVAFHMDVIIREMQEKLGVKDRDLAFYDIKELDCLISDLSDRLVIMLAKSK